MIVGGGIIEVLTRKIHYLITKKHYKEHHYTLGKYLFFLLFPLLGVILLIINSGLSILQVYLIFALVGTFL